jgi:hypothetical protein
MQHAPEGITPGGVLLVGAQRGGLVDKVAAALGLPLPVLGRSPLSARTPLRLGSRHLLPEHQAAVHVAELLQSAGDSPGHRLGRCRCQPTRRVDETAHRRHRRRVHLARSTAGRRDPAR